MDLITNYHGFKNDILSSFKDLIDEFGLNLSEPYEGTYLLTGKRCIIRITYDRGQIGCLFKQIIDDEFNPGYEVWSVERCLYPIKQTAIENTNSEWGSPKQQLTGYSNIIQIKFKNILNGDFSWLEDYSKKQDKEGQLIFFVLGLDRDHPIRKKFLAGDPSWTSDAESYMHANSMKHSVAIWRNPFLKNVFNKLKSLLQ